MIQGLGDQYLLPQWLPFKVAAQQREIAAFSHASPVIDYTPAKGAFLEALDQFRAQPSVFVGTELMGVADVIGIRDAARELAEFVLREPLSGRVAQDQARAILGNVQLENLDERATIRRLKNHTSDYPRDAIAWVDQARLYTVLGQRRKARRAMMAGVHLAPSDRFVIRAAVRFFIHYDEWDEALYVASRAYRASGDPLIYGPLLSVATRLGKPPARARSAAEAALTASNAFLYSEQLEAFGTLEVMNGANQRARKFFRRAWVDPTRSVIGHSQWILRERIPGLAAERRFDLRQSAEAVSWLRFAFLDFDGAIAAANSWCLEEPYSRAPYVLGAIAACHAERFAQAVEIGVRGLQANPKDDTLTNNVAFSYLRAGDLAQAKDRFAPIRHLADREDEVAIAATYGLMLMMDGEHERGVRYYVTAIERAAKAKNRRLALRASLNLLISLIDTAKTIDPLLLRTVMDALPDCLDAGSFGAALAVNRRLNSAKLSASGELSDLAKRFRESVQQEASRYLASVQGRFLDLVASDDRPSRTDFLRTDPKLGARDSGSLLNL